MSLMNHPVQEALLSEVLFRCRETAISHKPMFPMAKHVNWGLERYGAQFLDYFRSRIRTSKIDYDAWIYALRAACAGCLALYISFSLNLAGTHWALTTCYIVGSEAPKRSNISQKCCSHCRNIGRRCGEFRAGKRIRARTSAFYLLFCNLVIDLRVFLPLPARALGLCLGSVWIHHRHRRGSCGIGAEPSIQCNYEQSRKRHHWHSLHGCSKHDCFSGDRQSIFNKTSEGDRCGIVSTIVSLPVFRVG
jgi:Fusaric acid resistance protein family